MLRRARDTVEPDLLKLANTPRAGSRLQTVSSASSPVKVSSMARRRLTAVLLTPAAMPI